MDSLFFDQIYYIFISNVCLAVKKMFKIELNKAESRSFHLDFSLIEFSIVQLTRKHPSD